MTIYSQISENKLKTWLTMAGFIIIFSTFFYLIGKIHSYNPVGYFVLGLIFTGSTTLFSYFFSDKIILWSVKAVPANKKDHFDFYTVTENLAIASGVPMPKLYVINDNSMNAFATGRNPKNAVICATTGLLNRLERIEIEAVVSHELSHIQNYDILLSTIVAVLVGSIAMVSDMIARNLWFSNILGRDDDRRSSNQNPIFFILYLIALIITPLIATLIQLAISRKREYLADASGALLTRHPAALASALDKISQDSYSLKNVNSSTAHLFISNPLKKQKKASWLVTLFSTHPPVEERIKILKSM